MLRNYLLLVIRDFKKHPGFYITNIISLAVGLAACLMIAGYVRFHKSFDTQSSFADDTYRIQYSRWSENDDRVEFASASPTIGPAIKENFPETVGYARAYKLEGVFFYKDKFFKEEKVFRSESMIFELLGIPVIKGTAKGCLDDPSSVAISESTARKYFGDEDPIGKTISMNKLVNLTVTAVFQDLPANMHMKADIFTSLQAWIQREPEMFTNGWFFSGFFTYVRFQPGTDPEKINKGIAAYMEREFGKDLKEYKMGMSFKLQPLKDIHLTSHFMHELEPNGNKSSVEILSIVGWFILVIAWVNFFNLTTIAAIRKQREIAIRKTNGAGRFQLLTQLLVWSAIINLAAVILALGLFELVNPLFGRFTGIPENSEVWGSAWFYISIIVAFLIGTFSAGIYSMTGVYSARIVSVLKGGKTNGNQGVLMKKGLVALQFAIGIALIAATIGVYLQYEYVRKKDPGFNLDKVVIVNAPMVGDTSLPMKYKTFTHEVNNIPGVKGCSFSSVIPGQSNMFNRGGIYRYGTDEKDSKNYRVTEIGSDFFKTYDIDFIAGEGLTGNSAIDRNRLIVNAYASSTLGFAKPEAAIGQKVMMEGNPYIVSGVVIDFNQRSAKEAIEPQIFRYAQRFQGKFSINAGELNAGELMKKVEKIYTGVFPNNPYNASMLKDYYNLQFEQEKQYSLVFILFSLLVVFITILGLIGLAAYTAEQRKKEIGIRKTLGASNSWLFILVFKDYILLCLLAAVFALPVFHYRFNEWLAGYAMHLDPAWWLYILPVVLVLLISIITVWVQSGRIIKLNPVENLKYE